MHLKEKVTSDTREKWEDSGTLFLWLNTSITESSQKGFFQGLEVEDAAKESVILTF